MKRKKIISCLLIFIILICQCMTVLAEEGTAQTDAAKGTEAQNGEKSEQQLAQEAEEQERAASYAVLPDSDKLANWPKGPAVYADSAVVMDMDSGAVLYAKNMDKQHFPASITKLMTTLVALENGKMSDEVKFTEDSVSFLEYEDAQIGMKPGEQLNLRDALHAVLLASANEVSHAVAENVGAQSLGGNYDTFIQKMNERAAELGCTNSHWVNANGLHDDQHYTTAYDMALIASAVYQQPDFQDIMGKLEYKIGPTSLTNEQRIFQQNHKMLWPENAYYYEYGKGGKTGYTDQSKTTLVTMADNGKLRLAAVVLYDYGVDAYNDTRALLDYGFDNFTKVTVKDLENSSQIKQFYEENPYVVLPEGIDFSKLDSSLILTGEGIRDGKISYLYEGQKVGDAEVIVTEKGYKKLSNVDLPNDENTNSEDAKKKTALMSESEKEKQDSSIRKLGMGIGASLLLLMIIIVAFIFQKRSNKKNKR